MVHGESLGGLAASYAAMKEKKLRIDCVFINRTFASFESVAYWGAGIHAMVKSLVDNSNTSLSFCYMERATFSSLIGKAVGGCLRGVTRWKDSNIDNFNGIERSQAVYLLFGCDPVNDNIVNDLSSLKSANTRNLIQERLGIPQRYRDRYSLNTKDLLLDDARVDGLVRIFATWSRTIKNMAFLMSNKQSIPEDNELTTENAEVVAHKFE